MYGHLEVLYHCDTLLICLAPSQETSDWMFWLTGTFLGETVIFWGLKLNLWI